MERSVQGLGGARAEDARRRGRARTSLRIASLALGPMLGALGCGLPSAKALAVWIDRTIDSDGFRGVQVYDDGERRTLTLQPVIPGSGTELLQIAVDDRARGVVVSGRRETVYIDLRNQRRGRLTEDVEPSYELASDFTMTRSGDALLRALIVPSTEPPAFGFMALSTRFGLDAQVLTAPGLAEVGSKWRLYTSRDAPVMFWIEQRGSPLSSDGRIEAVVYPSEFEAPLLVPMPTTVARGTIRGRAVDDSSTPSRTGDSACPQRTCVSPSGRMVTTMAEEPCAVWQWAWPDAVSPDTALPPTRIALPQGCPADVDPFLFAAIDDDLLVLDDDDRIFLADLSAETIRSVPKVGEGQARVGFVDRGRAVLYLTDAGQLVRIDAAGPRLVSIERSFCTILDGAVASPRGHWVVMSCNGQAPSADGPDGMVLRVSALGLEQYFGINMRPLAIDDDGNALLYSFDADDPDAVPRGLFVLTGDGGLTRVDELEPGPDAVAVWHPTLGRVGGRFDATSY